MAASVKSYFNVYRNKDPPMRLTGRPLVVAMCLGQIGNLLPHVAVPAVMPQHLMPLWHLSGAEAGFMASAFAIG